tara:strand:- start:7750 stop:8544 length:795 start_codon:yes stop_codon:yes gene_type:complete
MFPKKIHFGGGAWSCGIYCGVAKGLIESWDNIRKDDKGEMCDYVKFSGDSAGAIIACALALGIPLRIIEKTYKDAANISIKKGFIFGNINDDINLLLDKLLNYHHNTLYLLNKRGFSLGVTAFFGKYIHLNKWDNLTMLKESFHSGSYIPFYCSNDYGLKDGIYMDGGFTRDCDLIEKCDLTVGVHGDWCISAKPTMYDIFFPPNEKKMKEHIKLGYNNFLDWNKDKLQPPGVKPFNNFILTLFYFFTFIHFIFSCKFFRHLRI